MINKRIQSLQKELVAKNIGVYIIPTADYHGSEYISDFFKVRQYMSGFTGSAGTLLVTKTKAYLFADGRYFLQAEAELKGSNIELIKMGLAGMPTLSELIQKELGEGENIGFDAALISTRQARELEKIAKAKAGRVVSEDLIVKIWQDRPSLPKGKLWILEKQYSGESTKSKIKRLRSKMREKHCSNHIISSLCDIAWLLNLRGSDVECTPVFLAYLVLMGRHCTLFVDRTKLTIEVKRYLAENGVEVEDYTSAQDYCSQLRGTTLIDPNNLNYAIYRVLTCKKVEAQYPSVLMRAIKNKTEIKNIKEAHIKDAVAMCKFMYWLKTNIGKQEMSELSVQDYLYQLRAEQKDYVGPSFGTICAYKEHAALMHYSSSEKTNVALKPEGLLLIDSGGHYLQGTTDITRTFALGKLSAEEKMHFTTVVEAVINLASTQFLKGCRGINLDVLCREPFWKLGMDYKCGTGHGVGYLLSVHEGPQSFRWQPIPGLESAVLEPGMVTTDEPGIYLGGKYGIRIENELLCKEILTNADGTFLGFEDITYVPIDLDAIDKTYLSAPNIAYLNNYHKQVYRLISPYLNEEEKKFLKTYTRAI